MFQAHPWHGVPPGDPAGVVEAYIEIVTTDTVKFELDKESGHLRIDRPQRFSSQPPTPYGFIPQTYCGTRVGQRCSERCGCPTSGETATRWTSASSPRSRWRTPTSSSAR